LNSIPIVEAVQRKMATSCTGSSLMNSTTYLSTAAMRPDDPLVGEVTMRPPAAFTSFTAIA